MIWIVTIVAALAVLAFVSMRWVIVQPGTVLLVYRGGRFVRELEPGTHMLADPLRLVRTHSVSMVQSVVAAPDVTVLSKDQFSFRLGFTGVFAVTDARLFHESQPATPTIPGWSGLGHQLPEFAPRLMAAALREVATLTLDEFLAMPAAILPRLREAATEAVRGGEICELLLTSVTMPPEVRKMFTEVERAKRESQAVLERARGEQASLRTLANAARMLEANPQLKQLRLLQTMDLAKGPKTFILGAPQAGAATGESGSA